MPLSRRDLIIGSAATGLLASHLGMAAARKEKPMLPLIDCHQHLWDVTKFKLSWLPASGVLARSYVLDDYRQAIVGTGIEKSVYMEVDVAPEQQTAEAEHLIAICKSGTAPTVGAVISGRPGDEAAFKKYIAQFKDAPQIKGVRQVLHGDTTPAGYCLSPAYVKSVQLLGEMGMSFDLCLRPGDLADASQLADKCPDTRLILDHCGNADPKAWLSAARRGDAKPDHAVEPWKKEIAELAKRKNTLCKISGIIARVTKEWSAHDLAPIVNHCLDSFGPDRVIFGSDWPVCLLGAPLKDWTDALRQIVASRPAADQKKLFSENATKYYRLS
ncbi:amidohydrolase [Anatilimnocola sp. NA78]|uniref:amidohydrolase family protein n=1 Tax=Anatilimnocola sp. NA78 TaxID=3415683 RepID=UPI003CE4E0F5